MRVTDILLAGIRPIHLGLTWQGWISPHAVLSLSCSACCFLQTPFPKSLPMMDFCLPFKPTTADRALKARCHGIFIARLFPLSPWVTGWLAVFPKAIMETYAALLLVRLVSFSNRNNRLMVHLLLFRLFKLPFVYRNWYFGNPKCTWMVFWQSVCCRGILKLFELIVIPDRKSSFIVTYYPSTDPSLITRARFFSPFLSSRPLLLPSFTTTGSITDMGEEIGFQFRMATTI